MIATDVDGRRLDVLCEKGVAVVSSDEALTTECDLLSPCAVGGIINRQTIPALRCRAIADGANNQLESPSDADLLRERGIAYAPDFVINAGGVLHGGGIEEQHWTCDVLDAKLAGIGDSVYEIFQRAERDGISTDAAVRRIAQGRIARSSRMARDSRAVTCSLAGLCRVSRAVSAGAADQQERQLSGPTASRSMFRDHRSMQSAVH